MVFGRIYDLEPQPVFFNVKGLKDETLSKYKKAKRAVRRGVVLFVDAPPTKYQEIRRRPFSGTGGFNSQIRANPQMANFYQLNKIALSQMNKKIIERKQAEIDPLKMAELALLAKINDNLEKKQTAVSIAQTEPPEDEPEKIDAILQAQSDLTGIEEQNKVLQEQLKQTRQQLNTLTQEKKAVEQDEMRDKQIIEQIETERVNERARFNEETGIKNNQFVEERMQVFEPEKKTVKEKIAMFEPEKLVEEGEELVLTEAQEKAFMEKLGKAEKKKSSKRTPLEQKLITTKSLITRFTNDLTAERRAKKTNKRDIPIFKEKIVKTREQLLEAEKLPQITKKEKNIKTRTKNRLIDEIRLFESNIARAEEQLRNYPERKKQLKERIGQSKKAQITVLQELEDEDQLKALRQ